MMPNPQRRPMLLLVGNEGGGVGTLMRTILRHMPAESLPEIVALSRGELSQSLEALGLPVTYLGQTPAPRVRRPGRFGKVRAVGGAMRLLGWLGRRAWRVARHVRRTDAPLIHANAGHGALAAIGAKWLTGVPVLCHWHVMGLQGGRRLRWVLGRGVDHFAAISESVKASLPVAWQSRTTVVYNAVDMEELLRRSGTRAGELRRLAAAPEGARLIASLGTYARHKGHHLAVDALNRLAAARDDVFWIFLGRCPADVCHMYLNELKEQAQRLGVSERCRFLEDVPGAPELLADADLLAGTTYGPGEGFGLVFVEAMAQGTPVVAFDCGAAREVIDDGETGLLVRDADPQALAAGLLALLNDPPRREALGLSAARIAGERFDAPRLGCEVAALHRRLARPPRCQEGLA